MIYEYTREFGDTIHSNPDTYNIEHQYEPVSLLTRLQTALPGLISQINNNGTQCLITTTEELTQEQEDTLTATIAAHKAVEDWPFTLAEAKTLKIAAIDARTSELIMAGFPFDNNNFSMSEAAQRNWIGLLSAYNAGMISFPFTISTVDEETYQLVNSTALLQFMGTFMVYQVSPSAPLGSGRILKAQVTACTTVAEVEAIVDPR